ncbi:hypothetical protein [Pelagerythrobacter sp.]|uniref:hypothetical protein n=1 Tax=Pelagerythrobacter sp. TaxID=2800702 RepID=UPI0035AE3AA2
MPIVRPLAAAALACLAPAPLLAQDNPQHALAEVLTADAYVERTFHQAMEVGFEGALAADASMAEIEGACPGVIAAMRAAVEPAMWPAHQRGYAAYRTDLAALFERELSDDHARGAADFFASPLGQRYLVALAGAAVADTMIADLADSGAGHISAGALAADDADSVARAIAALEPADRAQISATLEGSEWAAEFRRLEPQVAELQLAMANADFSEEEERAMDAAIDGVLETRFADCFPEE